MVKQTGAPKYVLFKRHGSIEDNVLHDFKEQEGAVNELYVPLLLITTFSNPKRLAEEVNNLELCDIVGKENPDLVVNEERTREQRRKHILNAPRVMRTGRGTEERCLYVKVDDYEGLRYDRWRETPIEPWGIDDYIASTDAAKVYLRSLGISNSRMEEVDCFKVFSQSGIPEKYKGSTLKLYLLSEINEIARR